MIFLFNKDWKESILPLPNSLSSNMLILKYNWINLKISCFWNRATSTSCTSSISTASWPPVPPPSPPVDDLPDSPLPPSQWRPDFQVPYFVLGIFIFISSESNQSYLFKTSHERVLWISAFQFIHSLDDKCILGFGHFLFV